MASSQSYQPTSSTNSATKQPLSKLAADFQNSKRQQPNNLSAESLTTNTGGTSYPNEKTSLTSQPQTQYQLLNIPLQREQSLTNSFRKSKRLLPNGAKLRPPSAEATPTTESPYPESLSCTDTNSCEVNNSPTVNTGRAYSRDRKSKRRHRHTEKRQSGKSQWDGLHFYCVHDLSAEMRNLSATEVTVVRTTKVALLEPQGWHLFRHGGNSYGKTQIYPF